MSMEGIARLAPPNPNAYEVGPGEQAVLRGIDLKNLGGMYGILLGARGQDRENQAAYSQQLQETNAGQAELARAQLAELGRQHDATTALGFTKEGLGLQQGLQAAGLRGLPMYGMNAEGNTRAILEQQRLRELGQRAKAVNDLGQGTWNLTQSGVTLNPGQAFSGPEDAMNGRSTVQAPLAERIEGMQQTGANARAAMKADDGSSGPSKLKVKIDPLTQMPTLEQQGGTVAEQAHNAAYFNKWVREGGFRDNKPLNIPPYPGTGASAAAPAPSASAATGTPTAAGLRNVPAVFQGDVVPREFATGPAAGPLGRGVRAAPGRQGNMDTARGATPPASQPAPTQQASAPTSGTAPPTIVEKARALGTGRTRWKDGQWYAIVPGKQPVPLTE